MRPGGCAEPVRPRGQPGEWGVEPRPPLNRRGLCCSLADDEACRPFLGAVGRYLLGQAPAVAGEECGGGVTAIKGLSSGPLPGSHFLNARVPRFVTALMPLPFVVGLS